MAEQNEKAFQKQDAVFLSSRKANVKRNKQGAIRYYRNVGLYLKAQCRYSSFSLSFSFICLRSLCMEFMCLYIKHIESPWAMTESAYVWVLIDKKCPFTGNISIRGRILKGLVISNKMKRTIIMRRDYLHYIKKYKRYEKRHTNVPAHLSPCFSVKEGDIVTVGQCRPLSKTVRFNVLKVEPCSTQKPVNVKKQFRMF